MRFFRVRAGPPRPTEADLARFTRLSLVGQAADHQLVSAADLPTKFAHLATVPPD